MPDWIRQSKKEVKVSPLTKEAGAGAAWIALAIEKPSIWSWLSSEINKENWYWISPDLFYFKNEEDKVKFILRWV